MDTRFLETFVEIADTGSMAGAARRLGVTPAAIRQRIQALESEIGMPLVVRSGRVVRPTEAGAAILSRARVLIRDARDLRASAAGNGLSGELRLGAISTALTGLVPNILERFTATLPEVAVHIRPGVSIELYRMLLEGELDAAIIIRPQFAFPKDCEWRLLREEPLVVLHSGPARTDPHYLLTHEPFIRYDRKTWGGRLAELYLRKAGLSPRERLELDSLEAIAILVDRGLGVSIVPDWAPPWPAGVSVHKQPLPDSSFKREVGVVWMRSSQALTLVRAFLNAFIT